MGTVAASDFERKLRVVKNEPSTYIIDHVPWVTPEPVPYYCSRFLIRWYVFMAIVQVDDR
jgi:hypothetical protein